MIRDKVFYLSSMLALLVSAAATCFCVIAGAGAFLDLLGAASIVLLLAGTAMSPQDLKRGSVLSLAGLAASSIVILVNLAGLVHAIPFRQQPGQTSLLSLPVIFLGFLMLHGVSIVGRMREARDQELLSSLKDRA